MAKLVHFTLASEDVETARAFYSGCSGTSSRQSMSAGELYRGSIAGLGMVICPTAMAEVAANRSRHQLQFQVDDVAGMLERARSSGGRVHTPLANLNGRAYAVICDPDNNTIELVEASRED